MPQNWKTYKLEDLGTVITGKTPSSKNPEQFGSHIPFVTPTDFSDYHKNVRSASRYLSAEGANHLKSKILPSNSILVTCIGSQMGKVVVNKTEVVTNQQLNSIIPAKIVNTDFLYYKLLSIHEELRKMAGAGSTMPMLNKTDFAKIQIKIPELLEQKSIASILSALDDKIELNLQMNKTLEEMAMVLYKHWFVDFGPFQKGEFVDSELGMIPKGWEVKRMDEVLSVKDGTHDSPKRKDEGHYLITSKHIKNDIIDFSSAYRISKEDYNKVNQRSEVDKGDILMTMIGTVGMFYLVNSIPNYAIKNIGLFKTSEVLELKYYMFLFFNSEYSKQYINSQLAGSTQQYLTLKVLRGFPLLYPDKDVISQFNKVATNIFCMKDANNIENQTLTTLRDTILPKLISGEVRIKDIEQTIAQVL